MDEIGDWLADFVRESSVFIIFYFDMYKPPFFAIKVFFRVHVIFKGEGDSILFIFIFDAIL